MMENWRLHKVVKGPFLYLMIPFDNHYHFQDDDRNPIFITNSGTGIAVDPHRCNVFDTHYQIHRFFQVLSLVAAVSMLFFIWNGRKLTFALSLIGFITTYERSFNTEPILSNGHLVTPSDSRKFTLDDKFGKAIVFAKRPAPREAGCRIEGFVRVKKVPSDIIVSARSESHSFDASHINMSHVINSFNFGKMVTPRVISDLKRLRPYIESHDKLASKAYITLEDRVNVTIEHYLQVVKTEVMSSSYQLIEDYDYTVHSSLVNAVTIPVANVHFEPSPMQILVTEDPKSFTHFIIKVCALIGGIFTVAGILESLLYNTMRVVKKIELGKDL